MIAAVRGEVLVRHPDHVVVEAAGIGYKLSISGETLRSIPAVGEPVSLHAHLVVREDVMQLYGFSSEAERELFLSLVTVSGVGPKVALSILNEGSPGELLRALAAGDAKTLQAAQGVGKRTAERIIVELREKIAGQIGAGPGGASAVVDGNIVDLDEPHLLAREGLMHLGYTLAEADGLLAGLTGSVEELINQALRQGRN